MAKWTADDLAGYGDEALDELWVAVATERERRQNLARIPAQVADLARTYVEGGGQPGDLDDAIAQASRGPGEHDASSDAGTDGEQA